MTQHIGSLTKLHRFGFTIKAEKSVLRYSKDEFYAFFLSSVIWFAPLRNLLIEVGNILFLGSGRLFSLISIAIFFAYILCPLMHYVRLTQDGVFLLLFICFQWARSLIFHMDMAGDWVSLLVEFLTQVFPYFVIARITVNWEIVKKKFYESGILTVFIMLGLTGVRLIGGSLFSDKRVYQIFWAYLIGRASVILLLAFFDTKKMKYAIFCGISIMLVVLYGTRTPLVCIVFTAVLSLLSAIVCRYRKYQKSASKGTIKVLFTIILAVLACIAWVIGLRSQNQEMESFSAGQRIMWQIINGRFMVSQGRMETYEAAVKVISDHPLFGVGLLADRLEITEYLGWPIESFAGAYAHNIVLEMFIEFGIFIGGMIIIWLGVICWKGVFDTRNLGRRIIYLYVIGFGIGSLIISGTAMECPEIAILLGMGMQRKKHYKKYHK